ncbi:MAG: class C sortase, partial [Lachnospiraceae bacterium]|nr:class C sortase [Lachnospiraceae bacterium]
MKKKRGGYLSTIVLVVGLLISLSMLLYPTVSNWWNSRHQSQGIASYVEATDTLDEAAYQAIWDSAVAYNEELAQSGVRWFMSEEQEEEYLQQLDVTGTGIMAYIEIPAIDVTLPIYHGTDESVLQVGAGHIAGSSLPVGGESTHCIISGHRGLMSAVLFSNLDDLVEGDIFIIYTLNETLTYEVDQIRIVEPDELEDLEIIEGEDLCTLVTCTPYGINSHRLLVRGHRVENRTESLLTMDATQIDTTVVAGVIAAFLCFLLLILLVIVSIRKRSRRIARKRIKALDEENKEARRPRKQRKEAGRMKEKKNTVRMRPAPVRLLMSA